MLWLSGDVTVSNTVETSYFLNILFLTGFVLLILVSGGILYLTTVEWRDRRRRDRDKKSKR
ncbi:conserved hypothetical protein [Crocosphaera subtropica ATCC 51142]|uniref:Uncharacterized protein n=1 Tax=Crocosphaera subtropica (strain ATCC 51142 / BH68) TaxID=43989 RepID=B1WUD9_CROS5|nr:conserved hypothetical protein [Crocosphaera subtropica ATCC 51142]